MPPSFRKRNLLLLLTFHLWLLIPVGDRSNFLQKRIMATERIKVIEKTKVASKNFTAKPFEKTKKDFHKRSLQEDKCREIFPLNITLEKKFEEISPLYRTQKDKFEEISPLDRTQKDKFEEISPLDRTQKDKFEEISPLDRTLEEKFEDILQMDMTSEDNSEEMLPALLPYLTPAMIEEARNELNETEELKQRTLAEIRIMIEAEKNLVSRTDDLYLLAFLRTKKYDVTKAFKLLQNSFYFRLDYAYLFEFIDIEAAIAVFDSNHIGFLPYRDRQGCLVFVEKVGLWNPEVHSLESVIHAIGAIMLHSLEYEATQITGYRVIFDFRGIGWAQIKYLTPSFMILIMKSTQFSFPGRYKGIHIVSDDTMIKVSWALVYPFLTAELKEMIFFHGEDLNTLQQYIHPSILPKEFGGLAPPFNSSLSRRILTDNAEEIFSCLSYGYMLE